MSKLTVVCQDWKPLKRNTLLGFARIHVVEMDLVVHDVAVHESHGKRWAQLPSRPWVKGNEVVTDDNGKIQYSPLLECPRKEVRDAFSQRVIEAVLAAYPNALASAERVT
jgi:hypothetical protein